MLPGSKVETKPFWLFVGTRVEVPVEKLIERTSIDNFLLNFGNFLAPSIRLRLYCFTGFSSPHTLTHCNTVWYCINTFSTLPKLKELRFTQHYTTTPQPAVCESDETKAHNHVLQCGVVQVRFCCSQQQQRRIQIVAKHDHPHYGLTPCDTVCRSRPRSAEISQTEEITYIHKYHICLALML